MGRKGAGLAARFRQAIRSQRDAKAEQERAREAAMEQARAAREALFGTLEALATGIGFVACIQGDEGVRLEYDTGDERRALSFSAIGDADRVNVSFSGQPGHEYHELYREPELDNRWVWSRRRVRREERLPLFDEGLEELLICGLGLPRPGDLPEVIDQDRDL